METPAINTPFYLDKALWLVVVTPILLLLNSKFGTALDPTTVAGIVVAVVAYIVAHKVKTTVLTNTAMKLANDAGAAAVAAPATGLNK